MRSNTFTQWTPLLSGCTALGLTLASAPAYADQTFSNPAPITIPDANSAVPYPSTITVSGITESVCTVRVSIVDLSHTFPSDLDILLVGPTGASVLLMSDCGDGVAVSNVDLTFDDPAPPIPSILSSGTFRPTNILGQSDNFDAPAPVPPYGSALSAFRETDPNGVWSLFIIDNAPADAGLIAGGWSITLGRLLSDRPSRTREGSPRTEFRLPAWRIFGSSFAIAPVSKSAPSRPLRTWKSSTGCSPWK